MEKMGKSKHQTRKAEIVGTSARDVVMRFWEVGPGKEMAIMSYDVVPMDNVKFATS
jgi:hypothetical protein